MRTLALVTIVAALCWTPVPSAEPKRIVVCAPGFPSSTEEAQPTMDTFAAAIAARVGWPADGLTAEYHPVLEDGLAALRQPQAALAILALPIFLEQREALELQPRLTAVAASGEDERWSLVAARGRIAAPSDLEGWAVAGMAGYSPRFVARVALAGWGPLPAGSEIRFEPRVLSALRAAARGEKLAVLLDGAQADSLSSLPYAADLEVVARSQFVDGALWCAVGSRIAAQQLEQLDRALIGWHTTEDGARVLGSFRLSRFAPHDAGRLKSLIERFAGIAPRP